jgi:TrpR-related protein YerC/YecD
MKKTNPREKELYEALIQLKSLDEFQRFFSDLCTPAEIQAMADRWKVAQLLYQKHPYREIYEMTGVSTATVTRVARCLSYGENGYKLLLGRLREKQNL